MDPRKATASVSYNGKRIDTKLAEYLQSFSYTDVASGESDSLSLNINDRDRKWIKSWFPSKGDTMAATIIMKNWSKEGDTQKLSCGSFVIDDFSFSGTPVKLKLEALALPADSSFKETQRTKTYEKTTLENIGQEVANRASIKLYYEAPRIPIEKVEQSEKDDCSFYNELVKLYGFAMKIYKNKIVVFNEATYEKKKSVATLTEQNIEPNWSWNTKLCRTYTGAKYEYTNNDKNQTIKVEVGGGNRILKVTDAASNASEAERITLAKINEANKGDTTMSVTMTRANRKIIATSCVTIKGFGKLDGKYYVEKVTWDIGSGCKQKLDLRRVADRFTDAKSSTKSVAKKSKTETKSSTATTTATKSTGTQTPVKGGKYTLTTTKKGYYTAAEALAGKVTGGHPTGTRRPGTYTIFNISQGMLNLTTKAGVPGSWINPNLGGGEHGSSDNQTGEDILNQLHSGESQSGV